MCKATLLRKEQKEIVERNKGSRAKSIHDMKVIRDCNWKFVNDVQVGRNGSLHFGHYLLSYMLWESFKNMNLNHDISACE